MGDYQRIRSSVKRVNVKSEVIRKQSTLNFPKNEQFLSLDTHTYFVKDFFRGQFEEICRVFTFTG